MSHYEMKYYTMNVYRTHFEKVSAMHCLKNRLQTVP